MEYVRPGNGYKIPPTMALTQKGDVNGVFATALFKGLKASCGGADVLWNFEAWTIGKTGKPSKRYVTSTAFPNSAALEADIDALLAQ